MDRRNDKREALGADALDELIAVAKRRAKRRLAGSIRPDGAVAVVSSLLGPLLIVVSARGVAAIRFIAGTDLSGVLFDLRAGFDLVEDLGAIRGVTSEIERYLKGDLAALNYPVDMSLVCNAFSRRVLQRLREIPPGAATTYQGLAATVSAPRASRAVGNAMANNPVPLFLPCHRVVRSDWSVGNYAGGAQTKTRLLGIEGFRISDGRLDGDALVGHRLTHIYCRPQCSAIRRAERAQTIALAGPAFARQLGMRPCKLCRPDRPQTMISLTAEPR
jgi:methylated-DNA-[protein]-cysteine S-methyltransferase